MPGNTGFSDKIPVILNFITFRAEPYRRNLQYLKSEMAEQKLLYIVDDDPFINLLVVKRFTAEGFRIEAFESGEECLKALDRNPDLIILDYLFLPKGGTAMNGMEILDRIRDKKPDTPIIMLSGQENGEVVLELARKGIADYIIKDNNLLDNLHNSIREHFDRES